MVEEFVPLKSMEDLSEEEFTKQIELMSSQGKLDEFFLQFSQRRTGTPGGVPQGSPLSPFLAILAIRDYLKQQKNVNYADDQIFYGNETFQIRDFPEMGVVHNMEKSG
jgi:retron-type reverse transcriptase